MTRRLRHLCPSSIAARPSRGREQNRSRRRLARHWQTEPLEERVMLSMTFTVTSTLDDGSTGSLRWAIEQVNADRGKQVDTIDFNIPGTGPFTITPTSALPAVTHPVLINGYSQPGSSPNTQSSSDDAVLMIELDGASAGYTSGLEIAAGQSTVEGLAIGQFAKEGIRLYGGGGDLVTGNFLGTDVTGMTGLPNAGSGVLIDGSNSDVIGGTAPAARNIVSGNTNQNVYFINGSSAGLVQGNFVGLTASGTSTLTDYGNGVSVFDASGVTVGGTAAGAGNVISGHAFDGVVLDQASGSVVQGNLIGTDSTGTLPLGNAAGVLLGFSFAAGNTIGGTAAGAGNLISGNLGDGILVEPTLGSGNTIQGNLIGTDISGAVALPNSGNGVEIQASGIVLGGIGAGAGNVISGNGGNGVLIDASYNFGAAADDNAVQGNLIGTDATGLGPLGNAQSGVALYGDYYGASGNTIGGTATGAGNIIAYNGTNGVTVGAYSSDSAAVDDSVLSNAIFANVNLGIDLGNDGVTPNNSGPFGPNQLQNYPTNLIAVSFATNAVVKGTLTAAPGSTYAVQLYGNITPDPLGFGQGQSLLASFPVVTDFTGTAIFVESLSALPAGVKFISSTATDSQGNTSEFSADAALTSSTTPIAAGNDTYYTDRNTPLSVPAPGVQANDIAADLGSFHSVVVTNPTHGSLSLNADGSFSYTPKNGFTGTDTFTYKDVEGANTSNIATVTINVLPKIFVVTNTNDAGSGSLRNAMFLASQSNSPGTDTIKFKIPGTGPFVISPLSVLPTLNHPTIIDGYTQPGASYNTLSQGDNAVILIQLDGLSVPGSDGVTLASGGSTVRGLAIGGFANGITLTGGGGDTITGDFIGTDRTGMLFLANSTGLDIVNAGNNIVGGTTPRTRNVISGNNNGGINIDDGSAGNRIFGNEIGTDATGLGPLSNYYGISLSAAPGTIIGSRTAGAGNVISGNYYGILGGFNYSLGQGPDNTTIQGNLIGTDATGLAPLGNFYEGVYFYGGLNVNIGGSLSGVGNVISATLYGDGVYIDTDGVVVQGNLIGTDSAGTTALPNGGDGVDVYFASGVTIGGTAKGARNVISGNSGSGVYLEGSDNVVQNNLIGTDITGTVRLGNGSDGVTISSFYSFYPAAGNTVGGTASGTGNVIAYNGGAGVTVLDPNNTGLNVGNAILSNQIFGNAALGIDLGGDGVTPNHPGGLIPGPNGFQNYPVLSSAVSSSHKTTVTGTLNGDASTTYTVQFFANATADPSGYGQGQTYLGKITVTTDASGNASFTANLSVGVAPGQFLTATATDPAGNTSEFAQDLVVTATLSLGGAVQPAAGSGTADALDEALQSFSMGVIDEATISAMAGVIVHSKSKPAR